MRQLSIYNGGDVMKMLAACNGREVSVPIPLAPLVHRSRQQIDRVAVTAVLLAIQGSQWRP